MQDYHEFLDEVLIPEDVLQKRIAELGKQISADYAKSKQLILVCILRGGVLFLTDLMATYILMRSSYAFHLRVATRIFRQSTDPRLTGCIFRRM